MNLGRCGYPPIDHGGILYHRKKKEKEGKGGIDDSSKMFAAFEFANPWRDPSRRES